MIATGPCGRLLVVGATGVLRPAVLTLLERGVQVVAVARNQVRLDELAAEGGIGLLPVPLDVFDETAVAAGLATEPLCTGVDAAILYVAGTADQAENTAVQQLSSVVRGTTVRILTSRWTPPNAPDLTQGRWPPAERRSHLLLGRTWEPGIDGDCWHTPEQISAAAVAVLDQDQDQVLGRT